jgi:hypothetical protein
LLVTQAVVRDMFEKVSVNVINIEHCAISWPTSYSINFFSCEYPEYSPWFFSTPGRNWRDFRKHRRNADASEPADEGANEVGYSSD